MCRKCHPPDNDLPLDGAWLALEPIRHEDLVLLGVAMGENIGALNRLVEVAKDVVDDNDTLGGV